MPTSVPKDRTIEALHEVWSSIRDLCGTLTDEEWARPTPLPGWSVQDNLSHIIGTEAMLAGRPGPDVEIDREAATHVRNDIGAFNEQWVESLRTTSPAGVLALFDELATERLAALAAMDAEAWDAVSFTPAGQDTYGRFMQIRVFDCWLHEQDMRDAVGRPGDETGLAVEVTLDELATALGFVVGKRAGVTSGDSVTFALTDEGSVVRTFHVDVGERAQVVDALDSAATVTLTMPVGVMTRLCAGRAAPSALRDRIAVAGDLALGERVIANLGYTI